MNLKGTSLSAISGIFFFCLGLIVTLGWYIHLDQLISIIPGYINMVFNTALCFIFSGLALFLGEIKPSYQNRVYLTFGFLILLVSGLTLIEYAFRVSLGIDQLFIQVWLYDQNPFPGRMAINSSLTFALISVSFILFPYTHKRTIALLLQILIFSIMLLGVSAILGYWLKLEFLYSWHQYTRMAIHTSIGITLLSIVLWFTWGKSSNFSNLYIEREDQKIIVLSAMILISIAFISTLAGFIIISQPSGNQTAQIIVILAIAITLGIVLLYWQVLPLVHQLVRTKKEAIESNARLNAIFNHAAEGIIMINTNGIIESFNPAASKMFGYSESEILGENIELLIPPDLREKHAHGLKRYLATGNSEFIGKHHVEVPGMHKNRKNFLMEIAITKMLIGNVSKFVGIMRDISERKKAEQKIIESEARFRLAFDYSPIGIALVSLDGHWLKVNNSLCEILGYSEAELLQTDYQTITHPDDLDKDLQYIKQLHAQKIAFYRMEKRCIRKNKQITWILITGAVIRDEYGAALYYIGQLQDINDKKKAESELSFKAYYDALTGLFNRSQLEQSLDLTISSALNHQQRFALIFLDIDHFKQINDSLGHDAGDELLRIISDRLKSSIRKTDIAARIGGDEFILVLSGADSPDMAAHFAEKILNALMAPITIKEHELYITASMGISFYPADGADYQTLIKSADLALYKAKEKGRNNYQFCVPEMNHEIQEKLTFKKELTDAIKNQELYLVFLPKIGCNNKITGFEALLRWKNEKYNSVSPAKIIPLAEEMGLINQLSHWIFQEACENFLTWVEMERDLKIIINISPRHFLQPDFIDKLLQVLNRLSLSPTYVELEISESLIMQDPEYSLNAIKSLKTHGIRITIDNFGTGYSSLNYLSQFTVDSIKISREFIQTIMPNYQHRELIKAIIALAKSLNFKVIAEGIENIEQFYLLQQLGCDEFQGYYFSQPLPSENVLGFIENYQAQHHLGQIELDKCSSNTISGADSVEK